MCSASISEQRKVYSHTFAEFTAFIEQDISTQKTRAFQEIAAALATMEP